MKASRVEPMIRGAEAWRLQSELMNQDFELSVLVCNPSGASGSLPVVYFPDADAFFPLVSQIARWLVAEGGLPPLVVAGVGYPIGPISEPEARQEWLRRRTKDLFLVLHEDLPAGVRQLEGGGAPRFLRCLIDELIPFVERNYPADPSNRTLLGSSASGHFVIYALLAGLAFFQRYIVGSPAWVDPFEDMVHALPPSSDGCKRKLFLSVGSLEEEWQKAHAVRAGEALKAGLSDRLDVVSHVFEGERHNSVFPIHVSRGLRSVFAD